MTKIEESWGSREVWAELDSSIGIFYMINIRESVEVPFSSDRDTVYRVSSGVLLVRTKDDEGKDDDTVVTPGDSITLLKGNKYTFSAIRDCEVYGLMPKPSGEKVDE
jgi:mannose-6-phosphate isomerase-like protein (cupin superfamily)